MTIFRDVKARYDAIFEELTNEVAQGKFDSKATIPEFLTPERALEIFLKAAKAHARKLNEVWEKSLHCRNWEDIARIIGSVDVVAAK